VDVVEVAVHSDAEHDGITLFMEAQVLHAACADPASVCARPAVTWSAGWIDGFEGQSFWRNRLPLPCPSPRRLICVRWETVPWPRVRVFIAGDAGGCHMAAQGVRHLPAPGVQAEAGGLLRDVALPTITAAVCRAADGIVSGIRLRCGPACLQSRHAGPAFYSSALMSRRSGVLPCETLAV